ncbi:MAG: thioredoxin [bacterium]
MSELEIRAEDFDAKVKKSDVPVVVDFFATWCGPCKMLAPSIEKLAEQYEGKASVYKVNTENAQSVAMSLGIRGVPTVLFYKDGREANRVVGAVPYEKLEGMLKEML